MPFDWPLARLCLRGAWGGARVPHTCGTQWCLRAFEGTFSVFANGFRYIFADRRGHFLMDLIGVFECVCRSSLMAPIVFSSMALIGASVKVPIGSFWRPASAFFKGRISYYELPLGSFSVLVVGPQRPFCWLV